MKQFLLLLFLAGTLTIFAQNPKNPADEKIEATVTGSGLNVRALANTRSEVLCQLGKDQKITVFEVKKNWARIQAPKDAVVWTQRENIKDGKVAKECSVYAGPAILYSEVSKLKVGEKIEEVRGSEKWVQIVPPEGISAWISAEYIKFPEIKVTKSAPKDSKDEPKAEDKTKDEKVVATLDPGDKQFYFDQKMATEKGLKLIVGTVSKLKKPIENLATHALLIKVNRKHHTICYLRSANYKLEDWVGKEVAVQGKQEMIAGWKHYIVEVSDVRPILGKPELKMKENAN